MRKSDEEFERGRERERAKNLYFDDPTVIHRCVCSRVKRLVPGEEREAV